MIRIALAALLCFAFGATATAAPTVIVSILPIHSIVAAVMGDTGEPELLLSGSQSEHTASFTPRQVSRLGKADLVFMVSRGLEKKLGQLSGSEAVNGKTFIELAGAPGILTRPVRAGGAWEEDGDEGEDGDHGPFDPHLWLDPANAKAMALAAATALAAADPANAAAYRANAARFLAETDALTAEIRERLAPIAGKPFIVFHDAYQYFEHAFGLAPVGSIADISAAPPSARRLEDIRRKLRETGAVCVFREPQFDSRAVDVVLEGSTARSGVLDPLGAGLAEGPDAYAQLLRNLAQGFAGCLG